MEESDDMKQKNQSLNTDIKYKIKISITAKEEIESILDIKSNDLNGNENLKDDENG
jgi:hypothetical protein